MEGAAMWGYYKRTFLAVQLVTGLISWMVYRTSDHSWIPTAIFALSMETSALFGAMWAGERRNRLPTPISRLLN